MPSPRDFVLDSLRGFDEPRQMSSHHDPVGRTQPPDMHEQRPDGSWHLVPNVLNHRLRFAGLVWHDADMEGYIDWEVDTRPMKRQGRRK